MATTSKSDLGRVHALWTLAALGQLKPATLLPAFTHENAGIREQAAKLSEPFLKSDPQVAQALLKLADDKDGFVQLQVAFSLGELPGDSAVAGLSKLANDDTWTKAAILTSLNGRELLFLEAVLKSASSESNKSNWAEQLAALIAARGDQAGLAGILKLAFSAEYESVVANSVLNGLSVGAERTGKNLDAIIPAEMKPILQKRIESALSTMKNTTAPTSARMSALRLARLGSAEAFADACDSMLSNKNSFAIQMAAVQALSSSNTAKLADRLISHWSDLGPTQRREVVEALVTRADRLTSLMDAMEAGTISPTELDMARRKQLLESKDSRIAGRAKSVFGSLPSVSRDQVLKNYSPAITLAGKVQAGENVFKKACATCHKAGTSTIGAEVGPNLITVISRSPADLLGHILEPNREIAPQYVNYSVAMKDGRILTGLIASESTNSLVLKRAEGVMETVSKSQVDEIRSTGQSLMPEGLEQGLNPQDFADLIAYIRQLGSK
jgi:putative heme-binding domain-containing protein